MIATDLPGLPGTTCMLGSGRRALEADPAQNLIGLMDRASRQSCQQGMESR